MQSAREILRLRSIEVRRFRNIAGAELALSPRLTVLSGDNGQGKTNLVEAIYWLGSSKSFRTSQLGDVVPRGDAPLGEPTLVRGSYAVSGPLGETERSQSIGLLGARRSLRIDGKAPKSLAAYALQSPAVVFFPGEIALTSGPSSERRRLLDRIAFFSDIGILKTQEQYRKALRNRQKSLIERGVGAADLDTWEELCVQTGLELVRGRKHASVALLDKVRRTFQEIANLPLTASYESNVPSDSEDYRRSLQTARALDARRSSASVGPHRDDLVFAIAGNPVKTTASQGQHRALVLSMKSAEMELIEAARGCCPILLLDDVSSELDRDKTERLFEFLGRGEGQVVLTTTRPEAIPNVPERLDYRVQGGAIATLDAPLFERF
jgi:DNA replication and repair protein RecF